MNFKSFRFILFTIISVRSYIMYSKPDLFMGFAVTDEKFGKQPGPDFDPYVIKASSLPEDSRFNPNIANGFLGHGIYSDTIYKNGLYNGAQGDSHRARIPGTLPYVNGEKLAMLNEGSHGGRHVAFKPSSGSDDHPNAEQIEKRYEMDMRNGVFTQKFDITGDSKVLASVVQKFYVHKLVTRLLVTEITLSLNTEGHLVVPLRESSGNATDDIVFQGNTSSSAKEHLLNRKLLCGHTVTPEQTASAHQDVCVMSTTFPESLTLDSSSGTHQSFTYVTSIDNTRGEAEKFYTLGLEMFKKGILYSSHCGEWKKQWDSGSVILDSISTFQSHSIVSGLYYLMSAFPPQSMQKYPYEFYGVSPGGLTNGGKEEDYLGHVFWDQDFWILPALLPIHPDLVKHGLKYRVSKLDGAKKKAATYGFKGAMYPWESAYTGLDVCPGENFIRYEQHVTGDMIHTLKWYIYLTNDWEFMSEKISAQSTGEKTELHTAWDMVYETALFWVSRAFWNETKGSYDMKSVMGPDEYHYPVNNSVFTNVVASQSIKFAIEVARKLGKTIPFQNMQEVADKLTILYDKKLDYHPEFEGFDPSRDQVKQADAIMLGYPLMIPEVTSSTRRNDLEIYEKITDPAGPAMTWGMFAINHMMLKKHSEAKTQFLKQYANIQPPFQIWSEEALGGGAVNFLTGIGGYLQSVFYGYLGLRIYAEYITLCPHLPPVPTKSETTSRLNIAGMKFKSVVLNVDIITSFYTIVLVNFSSIPHHVVQVVSGDEIFELSAIGDKASLPVHVQCKIEVV